MTAAILLILSFPQTDAPPQNRSVNLQTPGAGSHAGHSSIPRAASALESRLTPNLTPSASAKVRSAARSLGSKHGGFANQQATEAAARAEARARFPQANSGDIEAIVFLVMMQAARESQSDLKAIMAEIKKHNAKKEAMRKYPPNGSSRGIIMERKKSNSRDKLSDLSSMESMKLQRLMEQRSKTFATLSNILKKMSETSSGITQNLK